MEYDLLKERFAFRGYLPLKYLRRAIWSYVRQHLRQLQLAWWSRFLRFGELVGTAVPAWYTVSVCTDRNIHFWGGGGKAWLEGRNRWWFKSTCFPVVYCIMCVRNQSAVLTKDGLIPERQHTTSDPSNRHNKTRDIRHQATTTRQFENLTIWPK